VEVLVFERSLKRTSDHTRGSGVAINADAHQLFTHLCGDRIPYGQSLAMRQLDGNGRLIKEIPNAGLGLRTAHWAHSSLGMVGIRAARRAVPATRTWRTAAF